MSIRSNIDALFNQYYRELTAFVARKFATEDDAEDVVQDTFKSLLSNVDTQSLDNPRAYLYKTASNMALNRIRSARRDANKRQAFAEILMCDELSSPSPEIAFMSGQELRRLQNALEKLPPNCQHALVLSRIHGQSYEEIAVELGVAVSTVEKYMIRALKLLRKFEKQEVERA